MKKVSISLYKFEELSKEAQQRAIDEHKNFLDATPFECEGKDGELVDEYHEHDEEEVIESIEANEYIFFFDGDMAHCTTYTGKHEKSGQTELKFHGEIIKVK